MADINKTINDLEKFRKELFEMHDWWEENTVSSAIALLKEQKETISAKEKAIEEYETVLRPDIDSMWIRYAIKKQGRYMESFKHGTANWVFGVIHAHWFSDKEMAESFARITHGTVVEIVTAIKK